MKQEIALHILKTGANVFLTGEPGAGKTYVLNQYTDWLLRAGVPVAITASTGIAATHIGGMTIHSWSGIGVRDRLTPYDLDQIASKEQVVRRVMRARVLVIDEISMLDGRMLDMVDTVTRTIRQRSEVFGGLQVVLVGDFFQLPPIANRGDTPRFAFESRSWEQAQFLTCYLTEQHRQEDESLLSLLSAIRANDVGDEHYELLREQTAIAFESIEPTKLYTHNRDVDAINQTELNALSASKAVYKMETRGSRALYEPLIKNCLSPQILELKIGAMVMCTKNNFEVGYVNGTMGRVIDFDRDDGFPVMETSDGRKIKVTPVSWKIEEDGKIRAEIMQVPLRLAWAITIHKSQGMSLDAAEIDLRNAFTFGQGYVALSRVRTLAGMKLIGINAHALLVDPKVVLSDARFKEASQSAESFFDDVEQEELRKMQLDFIRASGGAWPEEGTEASGEARSAWVKKESTLEATKAHLLRGLTPTDIARERGLALSTIWSHVEKLLELGELQVENIQALTPQAEGWEAMYAELRGAFLEHGTEKLKPIYEALDERCDYDSIRLGRILYSLEK